MPLTRWWLWPRALNVVEPYMSGMGGDGYMHIYSAREQEHTVLDYMGRSPYGATFEEVGDPESRARGPRSPLVPGACGGWLAGAGAVRLDGRGRGVSAGD